MFVILALSVCIGVLYDWLCEKLEHSEYPLTYENYVSVCSARYEIPEEIIYAVIRTESGFEPDAVSPKGARGLMQLMPETFEWLLTKTGEQYALDSLFDPAVNIKYGAYLLSILYNELGVWENVYAAYNAGIGRVRGWLSDERYSEDGLLRNIPIAETDRYVSLVGDAVEVYKRLYFN